MKKILTVILLVASGATGWLLLEPALSDDVVDDTPIVSRENIQNNNKRQEVVRSKDAQEQMEKEQITQEEPEKPIILDTEATIETTLSPPNQKPGPEVIPVTEPQAKVLSGTFTNGKARYEATGEVFISGQDLSLVNLNSTNVPDGFVYLSNDLNANDAIRIEKLQGNVGNQNYKLPTNVDADDYKYVLIWCRAFSSLIGYAEIN